MTTATLTNTVTDATGAPLAGVQVQALLYPLGTAAFAPTGDEVLNPAGSTRSATDGTWSLALERTDTMTPTGMIYQITEVIPSVRQRRVSYVQVPAGGGTLETLLTVPPASLPSLAGASVTFNQVTASILDRGGAEYNAGAYAPTFGWTTRAINAAIAAAAPAGGRIIVPPHAGGWGITEALALKAGVPVEGVPGSTVLVAAAALPALVTCPADPAQAYAMGLKHLNIFGDKTTYPGGGHGIDCSTWQSGVIEDIEISACVLNNVHAVPPAGYSTPIMIRNLRTAAAGGDGLYAQVSTGMQVFGGYSLRNGHAGLHLVQGEFGIYNWQADQDLERGIFLDNCSHGSLTACAVSACVATQGTGLELRSTTWIDVLGGYCTALGRGNTPYNAFNVYLNEASFCSFQGFKVRDYEAWVTQNLRVAFYVSAASHHNAIHGCPIEMTAARSTGYYEEPGADYNDFTHNPLSVNGVVIGGTPGAHTLTTPNPGA